VNRREHEAVGPADYLRSLPPFDQLDEATFATALSALEVTYVARGTRVLHRGGEPSRYLNVVRKGTALLARDDVPILTVEPGEWFGLSSVQDDHPPEFDVDALDDLLIYRLPSAVVRELARTPAFAHEVTRGLVTRLRASSQPDAGQPAVLPMAPVTDLIAHELVTLPPDATVAQIARAMREERVSSVVLRSEPPAIVTTSDLRDRVLAEDHGPRTPGLSIASRPIDTVDATTSIAEARTTMLERSMHHLGVTREGALIAVITTGDVLRADASSPFHVQREFATAQREAFARVPERLHATVAGLSSAGLSPLEITRTVSMLTDVLVRRAVGLAIEALGPAPSDFAWLTLGSDARREQTLLTDQDHALVHGEVGEDGVAWFHAFAADITEQLVTAGLPRCPGGVMAINWSGSVATWETRFTRWFAEPDVRALYETSIFFDHRVVAGTLDVSALDETVRGHRDDGVFLARLASGAGTSRPPIGLLHRVRSTSDGAVDVKAGGINPIVALGRVLAVEAGTTARSTTERLAVAAARGALGLDAAEELIEGFRFFQGLRLEHHTRAWREGRELTNLVHLDELTPTRRRHLKEAFVAVARVQQAVISRLGGTEVSR
jgi:CBS domain-containing protein